MQVDVLETLEDLKEESCLIELVDSVVEIELLQHFPHVQAEASDVVAQVRHEVRRVGEELLEIVARRVVEGEARSPAELRIEILELFVPQLGLLSKHLVLRRCQHAVEPTQHRKRKDYVLILAPLEGVTDKVGNAPEETDDLAVVH